MTDLLIVVFGCAWLAQGVVLIVALRQVRDALYALLAQTSVRRDWTRRDN